MQLHTLTQSSVQPDAGVRRLHEEIRRAANSFLGITELLLDTGLSGEQREYVEVLRSAADQLLSVGGRVASIAGELEPPASFVMFDLRELVEQAADLMRILGADSGVAIATDISEDHAWIVEGDRQRIEQVLVNILSARIKCGPPGCITLRIARGEPGFVNFNISAPLDPAAPSDGDGDGQSELSMEFASEMVRSMGGTFRRDAHQSGLEFSIAAPLSDPQESVNVTASRHEFDGSRTYRVLVAEDSPDNQFTIRAYLKQEPLTIDTVETGNAACERAMSGQYAVILMDLEMPDMNGMDATKAIREWEAATGRNPMPIIALTAHTDPEEVKTCLHMGFTAYLSKPVRKQTIIATLQRYLKSGLA